MVKYYADWEITNNYENLQMVWSQFFTDKLLFIYIWSNLNIYWFISIQIWCKWTQMKSYSVTFNYSLYLVRYSMNKPKGKKNTIRCYLHIMPLTKKEMAYLSFRPIMRSATSLLIIVYSILLRILSAYSGRCLVS